MQAARRRAAAATSISDLPEQLIHKIISFLPPKTAARLCTSCKPLYAAWSSSPYLYLHQPYVRSTLSRCRHPPGGTSLEKVSLWLSPTGDRLRQGDSLCRKAIDYALAHGVKELSVGVAKWTSGLYGNFPISVLRAETVTVLHLSGLSFPDVPNLTLRCPQLELARIYCCVGIKNLKMVSCTRLEKLVLWHCDGLGRVLIDTPSYSVLRCVVLFYCEKWTRVVYEGGGPSAGQVVLDVRKRGP